MINDTISVTDYVPAVLWGRDHYSTLAYVETQLVDNRGYRVVFDNRMRQNRRHYRLLPGPKSGGVAMKPEHGSRLSDGTYLAWHDDWNCVQDMLHAGLFQGDSEDWDVGFELKLTDRGHAVVAAVRKHNASGGTFSDCGPMALAALEPA